MGPEEEIGLRLSLKDRRQTVAGLDDVGDKMDRVGDEADQAGRKARIAAGGLLTFGRSGKLAGRAVVYGFGAATAGIVGAGIALTKLSKDSIAEAREAQKVGAITTREIKATEHAANISAKAVGRLTGAISEKVGVDDEEIQAGANMILTFKNVRNEVGKGSKIFNRATRDSVDLAKAGFGSITSQSKVLAKALNDPIKGLAALGRSGVTFTQDQQDQIKYLVEHNDLLAAQKIMLTEVESQVGGVAEAQATWGEKASVSIGNIKESIGTILLPELDAAERWFVTKGTPVINGWVDVFERRGIPIIKEYAGAFVDKGIPAIHDFIDEAKPLVRQLMPAVVTAFGDVRDVAKDALPYVTGIVDAFNDMPEWAQKGVVIGGVGTLAAKKSGLLGTASGNVTGGLTESLTGSAFDRLKPMPVYVTNPGFGTGGGIPSGGGSNIPPVIPGLASSGWRSIFSKVGGLGLGGLLTGVTLSDTYGGLGHPQDVKMVDWDTIRKQERADAGRQRRTIAELMGGYDLAGNKAKAAGNEARAMADVSVDAFGTIYKALTPILNGLSDVTKPRTAVVRLDGAETAEARLDSLRSKLDALNAATFYGGPAPSMTTSTDQLIGELTGGGKKHHPKHPRVQTPTAPKMGDFEEDLSDGTAGRPMHVHVHVGQREIGEAVLQHFDDEMARQ